MEKNPNVAANGRGGGHVQGHQDVGGEALARGLGVFSLGLGLAQLLAPDKVTRLIGLDEDDRNEKLMRAIGMRELAVGLGMLAQSRTPGWAWARVAGDAMDMALLAGAIDEGRGDRQKLIATTAAVAGITGVDVRCATQLGGSDGGNGRPPGDETIKVTRAITVNKAPEEVYHFWRSFENLPRFMLHLESVETWAEGRLSRWTAKAPAGRTVSWDAEIVQDRPHSLIAWRSLPGADVANMGTVRFEPAPGDRGTEVHVDLRYVPPAGKLGAAVAKLFGEEPELQLRQDLYRFKQVMETGDVVHSDATLQGSRLRQRPGQPAEDPVLR